MADVVMPQLGETVTEGTITKWLVQVGDTVEIDQPLFEVSTDKVDSEVPATASGVVSELVVPEGETVAVGVVVARVGDASSAPAPQPAPAPATPARRDESPASYSGTDIEPGSRDYVVPFTNIRRRTAEHMIHSK
uniref:biotin/lipoyl-containing protein n=1 Tax=Ferrimicrobium acidiphilum TaxID=121039 RepID=UPI0030B8BF07